MTTTEPTKPNNPPNGPRPLGSDPGFRRIHSAWPIFRIDEPRLSVLYTPGKLAAVAPRDADAIESGWGLEPKPVQDNLALEVREWMESRAREALEQWRLLEKAPYRPECLTLCLSNHCRLGCAYCYSAKDRGRPRVLDETLVEAAALTVARNCQAKAIPFHLVVHGGGEPTLHWDLLHRIVDTTQKTALSFGLDWFGYIATNGVLDPDRARRLASRFTRIGLSCDGPPDIQDRQRPQARGGPTASAVARTARVISETRGELEVRTTLTPHSFQRQQEIVNYLVRELGAARIRFEPVYGLRPDGRQGFSPDQAEDFAAGFLQAQERADNLGSTLSFSGVRLDEWHGPFCDVLRNVLRVTPEGLASTCFLPLNEEDGAPDPRLIGRVVPSESKVILNPARIAEIKKAALRIPAFCRFCLNLFHCTRGCPDLCPVNGSRPNPENDFRCLVHQKLARAWILKAARRMIDEQTGDRIVVSEQNESGEIRLRTWLERIPEPIDRQGILDAQEALKSRYDINEYRAPEPVWKKSGFDQAGPPAWQGIQDLLGRGFSPGPMSMYLHIPFCEQRCGFCDCRALPLGKNGVRRTRRLTRALLAEAESWKAVPNLAARPVTTVHFGGGTPNCLPPESFGRILKALNTGFNITPATEWAVEITSRLLTKANLDRLHQWGFTRLHVGVQSLDDLVRRNLGRRDSSAEVLARIAAAREAGFLVSVDLIYGLPGQTVQGFLDTLVRLIDLDIPGLSLYRFNLSRRNRWFVTQNEGFRPDASRDLALLQIAEQRLSRAGYSKRYYNHYARAEDTNLYFTYPQRHEDLLALGPTADGVFGDLLYRHPGYGGYVKTVGLADNPAGLEGAIPRPAWEQAAAPLVLGLMAGQVSREAFRSTGLDLLPDRWLKCGLVREHPESDQLDLTASGAWLIDRMLLEVEEAVKIL